MQEHDPGSTHFNSPTLLERIRMSATVSNREAEVSAHGGDRPMTVHGARVL
jgi:hypothetical protein